MSSLQIAFENIRNEILEEAAKAAEGHAPDNEPGSYFEGRRNAAYDVRQLKRDPLGRLPNDK